MGDSKDGIGVSEFEMLVFWTLLEVVKPTEQERSGHSVVLHPLQGARCQGLTVWLCGEDGA